MSARGRTTIRTPWALGDLGASLLGLVGLLIFLVVRDTFDLWGVWLVGAVFAVGALIEWRRFQFRVEVDPAGATVFNGGESPVHLDPEALRNASIRWQRVRRSFVLHLDLETGGTLRVRAVYSLDDPEDRSGGRARWAGAAAECIVSGDGGACYSAGSSGFWGDWLGLIVMIAAQVAVFTGSFISESAGGVLILVLGVVALIAIGRGSTV